jgi:hypothetical protein
VIVREQHNAFEKPARRARQIVSLQTATEAQPPAGAASRDIK